MLRKWPVAAAALVVLAVSTWAAVHRYGRATGFSQLFDPPVLNSSSTGPPARPAAISRPSVIPESDVDARALWLASAGSTAIHGSQVRALSAHFQGHAYCIHLAATTPPLPHSVVVYSSPERSRNVCHQRPCAWPPRPRTQWAFCVSRLLACQRRQYTDNCRSAGYSTHVWATGLRI